MSRVMNVREMTKICAQCSNEYKRNRKYGKAQWELSKYCGFKCTGIANAVKISNSRPELKVKFENNFSKTDGCWVWKGTIDGYGYGVIDYIGKRYRAHVLSLEFDGRPVPKGMLGCHHCDNPSCVNPSHIYPGTQKDNANDAVSRKRLAFGERNFNAKLSESDVLEIRNISGHSPTAISKIYGVSRQTISKIINREIWRHL